MAHPWPGWRTHGLDGAPMAWMAHPWPGWRTHGLDEAWWGVVVGVLRGRAERSRVGVCPMVGMLRGGYAGVNAACWGGRHVQLRPACWGGLHAGVACMPRAYAARDAPCPGPMALCRASSPDKWSKTAAGRRTAEARGRCSPRRPAPPPPHTLPPKQNPHTLPPRSLPASSSPAPSRRAPPPLPPEELPARYWSLDK
jgi:hypothetical protein